MTLQDELISNGNNCVENAIPDMRGVHDVEVKVLVGVGVRAVSLS